MPGIGWPRRKGPINYYGTQQGLWPGVEYNYINPFIMGFKYNARARTEGKKGKKRKMRVGKKWKKEKNARREKRA
mgnify:CR=1 FL=1